MTWFNWCAAALIFGGTLATEAAVELTKNGSLAADGCEFDVTLFNKSWNGLSQSRPQFRMVRDGRGEGGGGAELQFSGLPELPDGTLSVTLEGDASNPARYSAEVRFRQPAELNAVSLTMTFPRARFADRRIAVDGKDVVLPPPGDKTASIRHRCAKLVLPTGEGELELSGELDVLFQELRLQPGVWQLRILFSPPGGKAVEAASLKMNLRGILHRGTPVDLRSAANMGFSDKTAGDGKGGWTDQGAENDLRMLPVGPVRFGGMDFEVIDPAGNKGLSCVMLAGKTSGFPFRQAAATGELSGAPAGEYLHLLHASAYALAPEVGEIVLSYADNSTQTIPVRGFVDVGNWWKPQAGRNSDIVWVGENRSSFIGLYRSVWKIEKKPIRKVEFRALDSTVWGIVALTVSDHPPRRVEEIPAYIVSGKDWKPFDYIRDAEPGSVMDFSGRLDAPAGKYGPAVIRNGHFEFRDRPGEPVRFFGANICGGTGMMTHEWSDRLADRLAAEGFNAVRFHHQDSAYTNPELLERFDYFIAALKKRGIYITTDLYVTFRPPATEIPEIGERPPKSIIDAKEYKGLFYVMDAVFEHYRRRVSGWLTHVNPYTGIAVKDEPALISLSYLNEANINAFWNNTPLTASLYQKAFEEYCRERGISSSPGPDRALHFDEFLTSLYLKRYRQMKEFLTELGVDKPFSDQNMQMSPRLAGMRGLYDYVDNHIYHAHPTFIGPNKTMPLRFDPETALKSPLRAPGALFVSRLYGKPFTITEFDFPRPNRYRAEGGPLVGAYSALQGYDAIFHFAYAHSPGRVYGNQPATSAAADPFDATSDPAKALSLRIGGALFLYGGVEVAPVSYVVLQNGVAGTLFSHKYPLELGDLGLIGGVGTVLTPDLAAAAGLLPNNTVALLDSGFNFPAGKSALPVVDAKPEHLLARMLEKKLIKPEWYDAERGIFRSATGQIELDRKKARFQVSAPGVEVMILPPGEKARGKFMAIENRVGRGVFAAIPHTGKTLVGADRILLLHLTDTQATKTKFSSPAMTELESFGVMPYLAERGEAELAILSGDELMHCYALNSAGKRLAEIQPVKAADGSMRFLLNTFRPEGTVLAYELCRK